MTEISELQKQLNKGNYIAVPDIKGFNVEFTFMNKIETGILENIGEHHLKISGQLYSRQFIRTIGKIPFKAVQDEFNR